MKKFLGVISLVSAFLLIGWIVWDERSSTIILVAALLGFLAGFIPWSVLGYSSAMEEERDRLEKERR